LCLFVGKVRKVKKAPAGKKRLREKRFNEFHSKKKGVGPPRDIVLFATLSALGLAASDLDDGEGVQQKARPG